MSDIGLLESAILQGLPEGVRGPVISAFREVLKTFEFGAPDDLTSPAHAKNFGGHLIPFTTAAIANAEVAVAHRLQRIPRIAIPLLFLGTVNATLPALTITRAADTRYLYIKSATTSASGLLYVE